MNPSTVSSWIGSSKYQRTRQGSIAEATHLVLRVYENFEHWQIQNGPNLQSKQ